MTDLQLPESDLPFASYEPGGSIDTTRLNANAADDAATEFIEVMTTISDACLARTVTYTIGNMGKGCGYIACDTTRKICIGGQELFELISAALVSEKVVAALRRLSNIGTKGRSRSMINTATGAALKNIAKRLQEAIPNSESHMTDDDARLGFATANLHFRGSGGAEAASFHLIFVLATARCGRLKNAISAAKNGCREATNGTILLILCGNIAPHQHVSHLLATPNARGHPYGHLSVSEALQQLQETRALLTRLRGADKPAKVEVQDEDVIVQVEISSDGSDTEDEVSPERE